VILVVDDEPQLRAIATRILKAVGYDVRSAENVDEALTHLDRGEVHLVITDMNMPGGSGLELLEQLKSLRPGVASIMLTAVDDPKLADEALDLGAYGYMIKPFGRSELLINVSGALKRRELELDVLRYSNSLEQMVRQRTEEVWDLVRDLERAEKDLHISREDAIARLSLAAEFRDGETANHNQRMSRYAALLAASCGFGGDDAQTFRLAALMHDVGKIGVPDGILLKPAKLTVEEFEVIKTHTVIGHQILTGSPSPLMQRAAVLALNHHERFDGTGYPNGIAGEDIPIEGRIAALADVFDAVTTRRVYRAAFNVPEAVSMMKAGRGSQFDPQLLDIFLDLLPEFIRIREEWL